GRPGRAGAQRARGGSAAGGRRAGGRAPIPPRRRRGPRAAELPVAWTAPGATPWLARARARRARGGMSGRGPRAPSRSGCGARAVECDQLSPGDGPGRAAAARDGLSPGRSRPGPRASHRASPPAVMGRAPAEPSTPVPSPPQLVQLRVTGSEVDVILRALRTTTSGVLEARRLADVLAEEAALLRRARDGSG